MNTYSVDATSRQGMLAGAGIAVVPFAVTTTIACSRIFLVNIIANIVVRVLTANYFGVVIRGISVIQVPLLWKFSLYSAMTGGSILGLSLTVFTINKLYQFCSDQN